MGKEWGTRGMRHCRLRNIPVVNYREKGVSRRSQRKRRGRKILNRIPPLIAQRPPPNAVIQLARRLVRRSSSTLRRRTYQETPKKGRKRIPPRRLRF